jgi:hypothetical protein
MGLRPFKSRHKGGFRGMARKPSPKGSPQGLP